MDLPPEPQLRPCYVNARPRTRTRIADTRYNVRDLRIQSSFHRTRARTGSSPLLCISNAFKTVNIKMSAEHPIDNPCLYLSWSQQVTREVGREKTYVTDNHLIAEILIVFGSLFLVGLLADLIGRHTPLPRVTLLMLTGFLIGPSVLDWLPEFMGDWFPLLTNIALAMIGFLLGQKLAFNNSWITPYQKPLTCREMRPWMILRMSTPVRISLASRVALCFDPVWNEVRFCDGATICTVVTSIEKPIDRV